MYIPIIKLSFFLFFAAMEYVGEKEEENMFIIADIITQIIFHVNEFN